MRKYDERYLVQALVRGLDVLECFARETEPLSLADVSWNLGWHRTEPYRYLQTLVHAGYLWRDPDTIEVVGRCAEPFDQSGSSISNRFAIATCPTCFEKVISKL
jgi:IclR helix-turn-helix domain